jgi:hypothetical protein
LLGTPAAAQSLIDTHLYASGGSGCFLRQYSDDHLAKHPAQMVSMIAIGRTDYRPLYADQPMRVMVMFRTGDYATTLADCREGGPGMVCTTEGDGGAFTLEARPKGAVLLRPVGDLVMEGAEEFHMLSATSGDDREFLIPPVPPDACP